jgi:hypothetical protein
MYYPPLYGEKVMKTHFFFIILQYSKKSVFGELERALLFGHSDLS